LLLFHLLDLLTLLLDFLLLLLDLALRLLILGILVLHRVTDRESAGRTQAATNCRASGRMAYRCSDNRACAGTQKGAYAGTLFPLRQRLA
jgi:hypothetical protein